MPRNTEIERGVTEQQKSAYQPENIGQKGTVQKATEQKRLGTLEYKFKCKWEKQAKKAEMSLGEGKSEFVCRIARL